MKTVCLSLSIATASVAAEQQLFNLRNAEVLSTTQQLSPLETVAHLETFDRIPVFGGQELRSKMLQEAKGPNQEKGNIFKNLASNSLGLAKDISRGFNSISQTLGSTISAFGASGLDAVAQRSISNGKMESSSNGNLAQAMSAQTL